MRRYCVIAVILAITLFLSAESRELLQPDWTAVNYVNSTTAYGYTTLDGENVSEGDLVGAFVAGECRGVQPVIEDQDGSFFSIVINGSLVEEVEFLLFRQADRTIYFTEGSFQTNPGGSIGYPPDFLNVTAIFEGGNILPYADLPVFIEATEPTEIVWEWGVEIYDPDGSYLTLEYNLPEIVEISLAQPEWNVTAYPQSTQLNAAISINELPAMEGDLVAAFIGDECRGTSVIYTSQGSSYIEMDVFGDEIMPVDLHIYSLDSMSSMIGRNAFTTNPGGMIGSPEPIDINADTLIMESDITLHILEEPQEDMYLEFTFADTSYLSRVRADILLTNDYINLPPVMNLPLVSFDEDTQFELNLEEYVMDPDGDIISLEIESSPILDAVLDGMNLTLTPPENWFGSSSIEILAFDNNRFYSLDTLQVDVISVNDLPQILPLPDLTIIEDSSEVIQLADYISDEDDESLEIYFSYSPYIEIAPAAPSWQVTTGALWATAYLKVEIPESELGEESVIAAFSDGECIGTANLTSYSGEIYAVLRMYCSDLVSVDFRVFESYSGNVYINNLGLEVQPNTNIGFPPNYYLMELTEPGNSDNYLIKPDKDWFGELTLSVGVRDDDLVTAETDLNILVDNIPDPPEFNFPDKIIFAYDQADWIDVMQYVYEPEMQDVTIDILSSGDLDVELFGSILSILPNENSAGVHLFTFSAEDEDGFLVEENVTVEIVEGISGNHQLVDGWNWLSFSWGTNHGQPNEVLESIGSSADFLKGQTAFILYSYPVGWLGSIFELDPLQMYKIRCLEDAELSWQGWDICDREISVRTGWNWISYLSQSVIPVNDALAELGDSGEYIKTQNAYAQYLPGNGWIGPLTQMYPGVGYVLYANEDAVFHYPNVTRSNVEEIECVSLPAAKEYTGSITAEISGITPKNGDRLEAYSGDEFLGYAGYDNGGIVNIDACSGQNRYFVFLNSDSAYPEPISLKYYNSERDELYDIKSSIFWSPDMKLGTIQNPVSLVYNEYEDDQSVCKPEIVVYPNPLLAGSHSALSIKLNNSRSAIGDVFIYNVKGQLIKKVHSTENSVSWDLTDSYNKPVAVGIYLVKGRVESQYTTKKILVIK